MASSQYPDDNHNNNNNLDAEDLTLPLPSKKSSSRRVSFAETTEVHLFERDEDFETPPELRPGNEDVVVVSMEDTKESDGGGGVGDMNEEEEEEEEEEDEGLGARRSFFRPIESPSPGSTVGSAASYDDEDVFFGPVSSDFIRPGRLSGSAISDDNHDITMDSAAFSMHFRSLASMESGGELKTPTAVSLVFDEKTPNHAITPRNLRNSMVLTGSEKKKVAESYSHISRKSDGGRSNEMTIETENPRDYDYGRLSPELEALLAEGQDVGAVSRNSEAKGLYSTTHAVKEKMSSAFLPNGRLSLKEGCDIQVGSPDNVLKRSSQMDSSDHININGTHRIIHSPSMDKRAHDFSHEKDSRDYKASPYSQIVPPNVTAQVDKSVTDAPDKPAAAAPDSSTQPNLITKSLSGSETSGSVALLNAEWRQEFPDAVSSPSHECSTTRIGQGPSSSQVMMDVTYSLTSPSTGESISCSKMPGALPVPSSSKSEVHSKPVSPGCSYQSRTECDVSYVNNMQDQNNLVDAPVVCSKEHISDVGVSVKDNVTRRNSPGDKDLEHLLQNKCTKEKSLPSESRITLPPGKGFIIAAAVTDSAFCPDIESEMKGQISSELEDFTLVHGNVESANAVGLSPLTSELGNLSSSHVQGLEGTGVSLHGICTKFLPSESKIPEEDVILSGQNNSEVCKSPQTSLTECTGAIATVAGRGAEDSADGSPNQIQEVDQRSELTHGRNETEQGSLRKKNILSHGTNVTSPRFEQLKKKQDTYAFREDNNTSIKSLDLYGDGNSSKPKRKLGELVHESEDHASEVALFQRHPKFQRGQNISESKVECPKKPDEVLSDICEVSKCLLPPCINDFDLKMIGKLENVLVQLQKVQYHDIIRSQINSQGASDHIGSQGKRKADAKLLLLKTLYAKARSELLNLTRKKLLSQVQSLQSGIKEVEKLKSECRKAWSDPNQLHLQVNGQPSENCPLEPDANSVVALDKAPMLRRALEVLEQKMKALTESFNVDLRLKGDMNSSETMVLFKNHLKKRLSCYYLRQDLKPWKIQSLESKKGEHIAVLSYGSFLSQRFKIKSAPTSRVTVSTKLDESRILKTFPNLDALAAFMFVLSDKIHIKRAGPSTFAQVTQKTSSILHNLLDVLEEVATARVDLINLTHSTFCSPSTAQLDLRLCFIDLTSGARVSLSLDVTCLKSGVYPAEVVPYKIKDGAAGSLKSSSSSLTNDIKAAVESLKAGYTRILCLCRCIAKVVQDSHSTNQGGINSLLGYPNL